ncbi:MAG: ABC transporter permease [Candidatus Omnitrophota bacterium]
MRWQLFVALRYLTSPRKEKFISLISMISILGIAVGVSALMIVIAVMSGFDADLKDKITGTNAHLEVISDYGMKPSGEILRKVLATDHVIAAAFFLNGQALVRRDENVTGIIVKGIEPYNEVRVNKLGKYMKEGSLELGDGGIVIGSELAGKLRLKIGDRLSVISPAYVEGKDFTVCGIFTSGMYEYDMTLAYIGLDKAQDLLAVKGLVSGISVRADDAMHIGEVKSRLQKELGLPYAVRTWMDSNKNLLAALKLEKTVMFIILTLIILVACFNISASLIMTVLEKTKDIGILKAIGATNSDIMAVFALQGGVIGLAGTIAGSVLGVGVSWLLKTYKFITLPKDIYYIDRLPVKLEIHDITVIVLSAMVISLLAAIYPSYKASRLDPVEALRYE